MVDSNEIINQQHEFKHFEINVFPVVLSEWLFPWEQSKSDDPWLLLELTKSSNFWIRQMGVASLADKQHWPGH